MLNSRHSVLSSKIELIVKSSLGKFSGRVLYRSSIYILIPCLHSAWYHAGEPMPAYDALKYSTAQTWLNRRLCCLSFQASRSLELSRQVLLREISSIVGMRLPDPSDMLPEDSFLFSSACFESYQVVGAPDICMETAFTKYSKLLSMLRSLIFSITAMLTFMTRLSQAVLVLVNILYIVISRLTFEYYIPRMET